MHCFFCNTAEGDDACLCSCLLVKQSYCCWCCKEHQCTPVPAVAAAAAAAMPQWLAFHLLSADDMQQLERPQAQFHHTAPPPPAGALTVSHIDGVVECCSDLPRQLIICWLYPELYLGLHRLQHTTTAHPTHVQHSHSRSGLAF